MGVGFSGEPLTIRLLEISRGGRRGAQEQPLVQKDVDQVLLQGGSPTTPQLQGDRASAMQTRAVGTCPSRRPVMHGLQLPPHPHPPRCSELPPGRQLWF